MNNDDMVRVARALAHPARVRIVRLLAEQTECRGADVFSGLPLAQSTVSEHLRVLKDAGLVHSTPEGTRMVYCLVTDVIERYSAALRDLVSAASACTPAGTRGC